MKFFVLFALFATSALATTDQQLDERERSVGFQTQPVISLVKQVFDGLERGLKSGEGRIIQSLQPKVCPSGFKKSGSSCYQFVWKRRSWYSAARYCKALGAHLLYIETSQEQGRIERFVKANNLYDWWYIGGKYSTYTRRWTWYPSGRSLSYTNWYTAKGYPKTTSSRYCMMMSSARSSWKSRWYTDNCNYTRYFICEK